MKRFEHALSLSVLSVAFLLPALAPPAHGAEVGPVAFSLSGGGTLGGKAIGKEEILWYQSPWFQAEGFTRLFFSAEGLAFMAGDVNGDGVEENPGNIDALHVAVWPPAGGPAHCCVYFSFSSNVCGAKDGDVLRFGKGQGLEVYLPESYFATLTGAKDGNVDVDAFTQSPAGDLYFSFADNEESSFLSGDQAGVIGDGDILHVDDNGAVEVLYTEGEVSALVSHALGKSVKVGDVLSLAVYGANLLFSVQSPTSDDASLFSDLDGGSVVAGYDEASLGFDDTVEMDALSRLPVLEDLPALEITPRTPLPGDTVSFEVSGATPSQPFCLLISGAAALELQLPGLHGFGGLLIDPSHPFFLAGLLGAPGLTGWCNDAGSGAFTTVLPPYPDPLDIHVQVFDPTAVRVSHPATMEMNQ